MGFGGVEPFAKNAGHPPVGISDRRIDKIDESLLRRGIRG
jgi:hypothetical protein